MKRKIQLCLLAFLAIAGIGWAITTETTTTLTVDPSIQTDTENQFKTLKAAVAAANADKATNPIVIFVKNGDYDIARDEKTDGDGNYLAITRNKVTIEGQSKENVKIYSTTQSVNGNWVDQNLITIHGDNVAIKNATIVCKHEVNKVIEILGDNVTLENLVCNAPTNERFAGSIYFNSPEKDTEKNIGTVRLANLELINGRITFTGAEKGVVNMTNIYIGYKNVKIDAQSMGSLQDYTPIGAIAGKSDLQINVDDVTVVLDDIADSYHLDANTIANLPAKTTLAFEPGIYEVSSQLVINKPLNISGVLESGTDKPLVTIKATGEWNVSDYQKNLISIEGEATGEVSLSNLCIEGSKGSGVNAQSAMTMTLKHVFLKNNTNAGLLVHGTVNAYALHTEGNQWGGVNIDKGSPSFPLSFTIDNLSSFSEFSKIWGEKDNITSDVVKLPSADWRMYEGKGGKNNAVDMYYWTNASLKQEVADTNGLKDAILYALPGQEIILTGTTYGDNNSIQLFGTIKVPNLTIKAKDNTKKPKVYGTFKILAEGCTIDGLDMYTKSDGSAALKNVVDVVAMSATITNNIFNMGTPTTGNVSNGLCIWPYGTAEKATYVVKGNSFNGFEATVPDWSSTAFTIAENLELSRFGFTSDQKSKVVTIDNEKELWTGNTFKNCYSDYVHSNWATTSTGNAAKTAPVYSFIVISSNADALETAVDYSGNDAQVYLAGEYTLAKPLAISQAISLQSADTTAAKRATIKGHLVVEAEKAAVKDLNFECNSTGYKYNEKNAISVFANAVTLTGNAFTQAANIGEAFVTNGIVLYPQTSKEKSGEGVAVSYNVTGNTFTGITKTETGGATSTPIIIRENFSDNSQLDGKPATATISGFASDNEIATKNTFTDCEGGEYYVRLNASNYIYSSVYGDAATVAAVKATAANGTVKTAISSDDLQKGLASYDGTLKESLSIQCSDVLVVNDDATAKALAKQGKAVKLLKYTSGGSGDKYTYAEIDTSDPHIVSLPDSVVFGVDPIKLITNVTDATISIKDGTNGTNEFVSLDTENKILTILKPGTVTLEIKVTESTANGGEKTYEQTLKILKRTISLTGGLKAYGDVYDGEDSVEVNVIADKIKFSGVKGGSGLKIAQTGTIEGKMADANVGTNKAVTFVDNAITLSPDSSAWYDLAPVTFVTTNISKKELTVTAKEKSSNSLTRLYGTENPEFDVTYGTLVGSETAETAVEGTPKFNCAATKTSPAGEYPVTPYGLTAKNYELKFVPCTLTVTATTPTVETVSAVVNKDKSITMIGKIVDNGGATGLSKGDTTVVFLVRKGEGDANSNTAVLKGNEFSFTTASFADAAATYTIQAKATIGKTGSTTDGTGKEIAVVIDEKKPQTVSFVSTLSKLTYGSSATLVGTSDEAGAAGTYTYSIVDNDNSVLSINEKGELTTKGIGKATVKVSRATDTNYAAADAYMTIEVTPKPVSVVLSNQDELTKEYDGTTTLTAQPIYALSNDAKVGNDDVSVAAVSGARFAGINAGNQTILLPEIKLEGTAAANYTLLQPSAPTGSINAKALTVKVNDAVRSYNDLYTDYTFTWSGFVEGENENIPGIYSGTLKVTEPTSFIDNVTEKTGTLSLDISTIKLANYTLKAADQQGTLTIKRGTPVAIVYGNAKSINTLLVDDAGYGKENLTFGTSEPGQFTQIKKGGTVVGQTLNKIADATTNQALAPRSYSTKAMDNWDNTTAIAQVYGDVIEIPTTGGYTYESSGKLTITDNANNKLTCKANGIGGAVIIATSATDVKFMYFDIQAQTVTAVPVGEYSKVYDGTTLASGLQVELEDNVDNAITDDIALNTTGINFNFETKDAGKGNINPSQALVLTGSQRNNYKLETALTGAIKQATLTISGPISKYYDGKTTTVVSDYAATGRIEGEIVPVTVTFADVNVNAEVAISGWTLLNDADKKNYSLTAVGSDLTGSILKSTMLADLKQAPNRSELIKRARFTLIETGETGIQLADYNPDVQLIGGEFYVSGGDTDNYTVTYASTKADNANDPTPPVGPSTVSVESVSLDATTKTLSRQESFTLKATLNPSDATNQNVTWKSSDETILKVEKGSDGLSCKVTALKVGKATVTVTTEDGGKTATCEVTVDFATGLEEAIANTAVYGKNGYIHIQPVAPMQAWVVNIAGIVVYHATISSATQIPVSSGIYLVKLGTGSEAVVTKVNVR